MARTLITTPRFAVRNIPNSLFFDGVDDGVSMGNNFSKERTDAFSISAWIKVVNFTGAAGRFVMSKYLLASGRGWGVHVRSTGDVRILMRNTNGSNEIIARTPFRVFKWSQWTHVVMTYDGSSTATGVKYYIDGNLQTTLVEADSLSATIVTTGPFSIGVLDTVTQPFSGNITDARLHNTVLTQDEINDLYYKNIPSNVQAAWDFSDGSGSTLTAQTGGIDGTISEAVWTTESPCKGRTAITQARTTITQTRIMGLS